MRLKVSQSNGYAIRNKKRSTLPPSPPPPPSSLGCCSPTTRPCRAWEQDINTLAEDHGTEWFSDTSPAAVQRRQDEARASSIGLDALASRIGGGA